MNKMRMGEGYCPHCKRSKENCTCTKGIVWDAVKLVNNEKDTDKDDYLDNLAEEYARKNFSIFKLENGLKDTSYADVFSAFKAGYRQSTNKELSDCQVKEREIEKEYVDMGLPSGNLWAETNEEDYYNFDKAVEKYGDNLPSKEDFEELLKYCYHKWDEERCGIEFMSKNGNTIFFPAAGSQCGSNVYNVGSSGNYWSSTPYSSYAYFLHFYSNDVYLSYNSYRCNGQSVRLIKRK